MAPFLPSFLPPPFTPSFHLSLLLPSTSFFNSKPTLIFSSLLKVLDVRGAWSRMRVAGRRRWMMGLKFWRTGLGQYQQSGGEGLQVEAWWWTWCVVGGGDLWDAAHQGVDIRGDAKRCTWCSSCFGGDYSYPSPLKLHFGNVLHTLIEQCSC